MALTIKDHCFVEVDIRKAEKNKQLFQANQLDTIVIHYTAGASAESSIRSLEDDSTQASAHLVVARDGKITQLVPFNTIAWHAGRSQFGNRVGFNRYSIGIEIDNAGVLEKRGDKFYSWFNKAYDAEDVVYAVHRNEKTPRYWHAFTQEQITRVEEICRTLVQNYQLKYILGHEEISPGRKIDPGPAFPLDKLREWIFGGSRDSDEPERPRNEGLVNTDLLNIRTEASTNADKVAKPLTKGQRVRILAAKDGWYKVSTEVTGWVSAKYIE